MVSGFHFTLDTFGLRLRLGVAVTTGVNLRLSRSRNKNVNVTELVYVLDLKSNDCCLKGSTPFIHNRA